MSHSLHRAVPALVVALLAVTTQTVVADPGFGLLKKRKITLAVRRPAVVRLANTSIAFRGSVANTAYQPVVGSLEATLETELLSNEHSLVKKSPADADWVLAFAVTGFSVPPAKERIQPVKDNIVLTFVRWTGSVNVAYQVIDRNGRVYAAENVSTNYDREFETKGPSGGFKIPFVGKSKSPEAVPRTGDDVMQILVHDVVRQVATNLGNTVQPIEAQVAAGQEQLDRAADFMDQRLWARAVEVLEKTPPFAKLADESYRQYNLGLVYEAMSYEAKNYNDQRANLFKAQEYYDKAADMNTGQKYFIEVVARLKESIARYRTLDVMQREDQRSLTQKAPAAPAPPAKSAVTTSTAPSGSDARSGKAGANAGSASAKPATASARNAAKPQSKALTVGDVIEMHNAGVQNQQIVEIIRNSPAQFNLLDKDTVVAIARAKLPLSLQNEMRRKAGLAPLGTATQP